MASLIYSAFPQTLEMLWTLGLLLADDTLANLMAWTLAVAGVLGVMAFADRFLSRSAGWRAAALLATMPAFLLLSSGGYVDAGLTVFSFLSFYALCLGSLTPASAPATFLGGLLAGWAMGTKYTGGISFAIGGMFVLGWQRRAHARAMIQSLSLYAAGALLVFSPWLIKNLIYVGNPVFPFFHDYGIARLNPWLGQAAAGYFAGITEYAPHHPWELIKLLWDISAHGLDFGHGMDVLGDIGWAPFVALLPALIISRRPPAIRWLIAYAFFFFVPWGMTRPVLRFLLPLAPLLALLSGWAWDQASQNTFHPAAARALRGLVAALLISSISLFFYLSDVLMLFNVPLGLQDRAAFLQQRLDYYAAAEYVNHDPTVTRVYVVGDQRGYYYNKPAVITPVFSKNPLADWIEASPSETALLAQLRARGISHLLVNRNELRRLAPYRTLPLSAPAQERWDALLLHLRKVYEDRACEVLAL
jgi:4-amino-4-deoxy-L-arabinose transferase-like glycosyltransferase